MKIIFDSEEEKNKFFGDISMGICPSNLSTEYLNGKRCYRGDRDCAKCWENCGIKFEIGGK